MLTRENLRGIFAAVPIPWDEHGRFQETVFRRDIATLCASGVHGIYTTGTTGEFYALDFEEFRGLVDAFLAEAKLYKTTTQVGCTALNTRDAVRMASYAVDKGVDGVQVALPFWMPLNDREIVDFFREVSRACGDTPLVHYNTNRSKRFLGVQEYVMILQEVPTIIGTKFGSSDFGALSDLLLHLPQLAHFVGEHMMLPGVMLGARGCYSSLALLNPWLTNRFFDICEKKHWESAIEMQRKVSRFFIEALFPLFEQGYNDAAIDKAMAAATGFLQCSPRVRAPYASLPPEFVAQIKNYLELNMPEFLDKA